MSHLIAVNSHQHCRLSCCHHTFTMVSDESTESIFDIVIWYSLALADLNNNSSVFFCKTAWIYNLSQSTLQACWKERQSAKTFHITQQQLSVHEKNALIQWIDTMTVWEWSSQIEQLKFMIKQLIKAKSDQNSLEHNWYLSFLSWHSEFKTQYSHNLN